MAERAEVCRGSARRNSRGALRHLHRRELPLSHQARRRFDAFVYGAPLGDLIPTRPSNLAASTFWTKRPDGFGHHRARHFLGRQNQRGPVRPVPAILVPHWPVRIAVSRTCIELHRRWWGRRFAHQRGEWRRESAPERRTKARRKG